MNSSNFLTLTKCLWFQKRTKVILPKHHPNDYFKSNWNTSLSLVPKQSSAIPVYYKITLLRSLTGLPWSTRYSAGILFDKFSSLKKFKPKSVRPNLSTHTVIFKAPTEELATRLFELKEIIKVENIWTEEEYRTQAKCLLGSKALTSDELQQRRGYYVLKNAVEKASS